jgi:hypothetical protein
VAVIIPYLVIIFQPVQLFGFFNKPTTIPFVSAVNANRDRLPVDLSPGTRYLLPDDLLQISPLFSDSFPLLLFSFGCGMSDSDVFDLTGLANDQLSLGFEKILHQFGAIFF